MITTNCVIFYRDQLRRLLKLPTFITVEYKKHQDSMSDKSSFRNTVVWRPPARTNTSGAAPYDKQQDATKDKTRVAGGVGGAAATVKSMATRDLSGKPRDRAGSMEQLVSPPRNAWAQPWKAGSRLEGAPVTDEKGKEAGGGGSYSGNPAWSKGSGQKDSEGSSSGWVRGRGLGDKKEEGGGEGSTPYRAKGPVGGTAGITSSGPNRGGTRDREVGGRKGEGEGGDSNASAKRSGVAGNGGGSKSYSTGSGPSSADQNVWTRARPVDSLMGEKPAETSKESL